MLPGFRSTSSINCVSHSIPSPEVVNPELSTLTDAGPSARPRNEDAAILRPRSRVDRVVVCCLPFGTSLPASNATELNESLPGLACAPWLPNKSIHRRVTFRTSLPSLLFLQHIRIFVFPSILLPLKLEIVTPDVASCSTSEVPIKPFSGRRPVLTYALDRKI